MSDFAQPPGPRFEPAFAAPTLPISPTPLPPPVPLTQRPLPFEVRLATLPHYFSATADKRLLQTFVLVNRAWSPDCDELMLSTTDRLSTCRVSSLRVDDRLHIRQLSRSQL